MSLREAAQTALEAAAEPLHYRELTHRIRQAGMCQTEGKTPEATLGTLIFLEQWNDFMGPLIITSRPGMRTLTVGLATMVREEGAAGMEMADAVLSFLPTFVLYLVAQKQLIQGLALSGLKG